MLAKQSDEWEALPEKWTFSSHFPLAGIVPDFLFTWTSLQGGNHSRITGDRFNRVIQTWILISYFLSDKYSRGQAISDIESHR